MFRWSMIVIRIAYSDPENNGARAAHLQAHKDFLRQSSIRILQSGPFKAEGAASGALIVAEVSSVGEMREFSDRDPFVVHGVYVSVVIAEWTITLVFPS